jgi:hypothetical protein
MKKVEVYVNIWAPSLLPSPAGNGIKLESGNKTIAAFCGDEDEQQLEALIGRPPNMGKTWHLSHEELLALEVNGLVTIN